MAEDSRPLAIVTGASSGIGYELAKLFAQDGYDLIVAADQADIEQAAQVFRNVKGGDVQALQVDLSTDKGVQELYEKAKATGRPVDALAANAGIGLGHGFLDQDWDDILKVINTNITGTINLIQLVGRDMRQRDHGRILITGSIAGLMPGSFQAVYNGTKAFLDSFSFALRNELKETNVSVTVLMPGPVDTEFFERADMMDTKVGQDPKKSDPADVAKDGYEAMMKGEGDRVSGAKNKLQAAMAAVTPETALAEMHRGMAEPGSGKN
jgi:short-subunit dehydrogenase